VSGVIVGLIPIEIVHKLLNFGTGLAFTFSINKI